MRTVAVIAVGVGISFFGLSPLIGTPANDAFLLAIGVTVALVPEGLLPTVTLSLAIGAQRMAGTPRLVRHLEAVETLGSTTFICTDKTGTLTRNEMSVVELWTPAGIGDRERRGVRPRRHRFGSAPALEDAKATAEQPWRARGPDLGQGGVVEARGDPMEAAIHALARCGFTSPTNPRLRPDGSPSTPIGDVSPRCTATTLVVKGAPDAVLPRCAHAGTLDGLR